MRQHECRPLQFGNHIRHGKSLARSGHTQKRLLRQTLFYAVNKLFNRFGLVTGWFIVGMEFKHNIILIASPAILRGEAIPFLARHGTRLPRRSERLGAPRNDRKNLLFYSLNFFISKQRACPPALFYI